MGQQTCATSHKKGNMTQNLNQEGQRLQRMEGKAKEDYLPNQET